MKTHDVLTGLAASVTLTLVALPPSPIKMYECDPLPGNDWHCDRSAPGDPGRPVDFHSTMSSSTGTAMTTWHITAPPSRAGFADEGAFLPRPSAWPSAVPPTPWLTPSVD